MDTWLLDERANAENQYHTAMDYEEWEDAAFWSGQIVAYTRVYAEVQGRFTVTEALKMAIEVLRQRYKRADDLFWEQEECEMRTLVHGRASAFHEAIKILEAVVEENHTV